MPIKRLRKKSELLRTLQMFMSANKYKTIKETVIDGIKEKIKKGKSSEYLDTKIWWRKSQYLHIGWSEDRRNVLEKTRQGRFRGI